MEVEPNNGAFAKSFDTKFTEQRDKSPSIIHLMEKIDSEEDMIYGLFINFFNTFCQSGGLKAVLEILSTEKFAERVNALGLTNYKLSLDVIATLLAPFKAIRSIAKDDVCKELVLTGKAIFFQRIESLEEKEIKDINKELVSGSMNLMKGFLKIIYTDEEAAKIVQVHEMLLSLKFLQSGSLEKRLNGLADIKHLIDRADYSPRYAYQQQTLPKETWLTSDYLVKWIIEHKILEMILNENAHAELVRRTAYILTFLAKKRAITKGMIELLWKSQMDKHEDIVRVVYDTIKELVDFLSVEVCAYSY